LVLAYGTVLSNASQDVPLTDSIKSALAAAKPVRGDAMRSTRKYSTANRYWSSSSLVDEAPAGTSSCNSGNIRRKNAKLY
jgi:hypothetical protein